MFEKPEEVLLAEEILEAPHKIRYIRESELQRLANWVISQWQVISFGDGMLEAAHEDNLDQQREEHGNEHYPRQT